MFADDFGRGSDEAVNNEWRKQQGAGSEKLRDFDRICRIDKSNRI
ncbi:MAG: hypothetical protein ABSF90_29635 [Syntrophobacteraceae bacterium]